METRAVLQNKSDSDKKQLWLKHYYLTMQKENSLFYSQKGLWVKPTNHSHISSLLGQLLLLDKGGCWTKIYTFKGKLWVEETCCDNHCHSTSHRLHTAVTGHFSRTQWLSAHCCTELCSPRWPLSLPGHSQNRSTPAAAKTPRVPCSDRSLHKSLWPLGPRRGPAGPAPWQACRRCHSPGVDLQLAGRHIAAGELVHAVVPPIVGSEDAKQQRARLWGEARVRIRTGMGQTRGLGWGATPRPHPPPEASRRHQTLTTPPSPAVPPGATREAARQQQPALWTPSRGRSASPAPSWSPPASPATPPPSCRAAPGCRAAHRPSRESRAGGGPGVAPPPGLRHRPSLREPPCHVGKSWKAEKLFRAAL